MSVTGSRVFDLVSKSPTHTMDSAVKQASTHSSLFFENSTAASSPFLNAVLLLLLDASSSLAAILPAAASLPRMLIDIDDMAA